MSFTCILLQTENCDWSKVILQKPTLRRTITGANRHLGFRFIQNTFGGLLTHILIGDLILITVIPPQKQASKAEVTLLADMECLEVI